MYQFTYKLNYGDVNKYLSTCVIVFLIKFTRVSLFEKNNSGEIIFISVPKLGKQNIFEHSYCGLQHKKILRKY